MFRNLLIVLLTLTPLAAVADLPCVEGLFDTSDLDEAFDEANFVFVATVIGENEQGVVLKYKLHAPALKGPVPSTGEITQASQCWGIPFLNGSAILVLFMDSLDQPVARSDWQLVALAENEPGLTWVSDWLADKMSNAALD